MASDLYEVWNCTKAELLRWIDWFRRRVELGSLTAIALVGVGPKSGWVAHGELRGRPYMDLEFALEAALGD